MKQTTNATQKGTAYRKIQLTFSTNIKDSTLPPIIKEKWRDCVGQIHGFGVKNVYGVAQIINYYRKSLKGVKFGTAIHEFDDGVWLVAVALNTPDIGEKHFILSLARYLRDKHGKDYDLFTSKPMKVSKTFRKMLKEMETALVSKSTLKLHSLLLEI